MNVKTNNDQHLKLCLTNTLRYFFSNFSETSVTGHEGFPEKYVI